ncbi:MAG TPA: metallophosphoesterase [Steroidobacteraceae bacterium]
MIRFRIFSDLHLEFCDWTPPGGTAEAVLLAGDISVGKHGIEWARRHFADSPIIYVPGNHEFYGARLPDALDVLREAARRCDVHLLDGDSCVVDGTRFLGATLWTDYALYGSEPADLDRAMADAIMEMNDFRAIKWANGAELTPAQLRDIHLTKARWLADALAQPFSGPTVVITHHLPHRLSIHPRFEGTRYNPCFASDLDHLVRPPVALWVHGHTHESLDYTVNGTRVFCNPRGYLPREPNPSFDPAGRVELQAT